jgi:4-amino-4-deoxy-L-arabinose transferase-like glycosyltransferase
LTAADLNVPRSAPGPGGSTHVAGFKERAVVYALLGFMFSLRILYVFRYNIDTDEPQHLHVVWGWTRGLVQYRDLFDNHCPLFHLLFAPLFALLGERPDIIVLMRLAMLPLYGISVWASYRIARQIFSRRTALWAALLTGLFPPFFLCSIEFRTDNLWAVFWLLALVILLSGPPAAGRSFTAGLLLGMAAATSQKTLWMCLALVVAGDVTLRLMRTAQMAKVPPGCICRWVGLFLAGFSVIPLALILFFIQKGALGACVAGVVTYNMIPYYGRGVPGYILMPAFPLGVLVMAWGIRALVRRGFGLKGAFLCLAAGTYILAHFSFSPLVNLQDYQPFCPLFVVCLTPLILNPLQWKGLGPYTVADSPRPRGALVFPASFVLLEVALVLFFGQPWLDGTQPQTRLLRDVLLLSRPVDRVLDLKGETIYRPRSFYLILESVTRERLRRGSIRDDIPEHLAWTATCLVAPDNPDWPLRTRRFLAENYLPVGHVRVAGRILAARRPGTSDAVSFMVFIPAPYVIVAESGPLTGSLDATPYQGERFLQAGVHTFRPSSPTGRLALVWARAVTVGFSPFSVEAGRP